MSRIRFVRRKWSRYRRVSPQSGNFETRFLLNDFRDVIERRARRRAEGEDGGTRRQFMYYAARRSAGEAIKKRQDEIDDLLGRFGVDR